MAFFKASIEAPPEPLIPRCGACGLYRYCSSPKMEWSGLGKLGVLVVAEAPDKTDDEQGTQFAGEAGRYLRHILQTRIGIDLDTDCWKTNAAICRPLDNKMKVEYVDYCRPNLVKTIQELNPRVIILMGGSAIRSLLGRYWKENTGSVDLWLGWKIPLQDLNAWVIPTWDPGYVMQCERGREMREAPVVRLWFERHLESAFSLTARPWPKLPNWHNDVDVVLDAEVAAERIYRIVRSNAGAVAFDYETNRNKPNYPDAEIRTCAICWAGKDTFAYPFQGRAIEATGELLKSSMPKIGANAKFEDLWTRRVFGHGVNNWKWDTMLSAHHLDCRRGITSVKFQAFVRLGFARWSKQVEQYLSDTDKTGVNQIRQCPIMDLLRYNALDALVEYKLAEVQRKEMRCEKT